jgi:hypothetical protein
MRLATRKGATCSTEERPQEALDRYHRDVTVRHTAAIQVAPTRDFVGYNRMTEQQDSDRIPSFTWFREVDERIPARKVSY